MRRLGQYEIIRRLGSGAMGEVYLAEHALMRALYAVKVLPGELSSSVEFQRRFVDEARVMAGLRHPNIVQVHNMDVEGDVHYIVMDFVSPDGKSPQSLDDLLRARGGRLPAEEAGRILEQVCEALIHSHEHGVVHCDIKPANVLLDKNNTVRVSDFGLAKIMGGAFIQQSIAMSISGSIGAGQTIAPKQHNVPADDSLGAEDTLGDRGSSRAQSIVGTFHYMPPEVQEGGEWTPRGDIYSLGVLAYVLLTGTRPVGRWKLPGHLVKEVSTSWDSLVERALEADPAERFRTVQELLEGLRTPAVNARGPIAVGTRTASRAGVPGSVVDMARAFVEEHGAHWDRQQFLEFVVQAYEDPAHAGLSKESIGAALESEKDAWLEEDARRKAEEARQREARARSEAAEDAAQRNKEAEDARRHAEEQRKAASERRRVAESERAPAPRPAGSSKSIWGVIGLIILMVLLIVGVNLFQGQDEAAQRNMPRQTTNPTGTARPSGPPISVDSSAGVRPSEPKPASTHVVSGGAPRAGEARTFSGIEMVWIPPGEFMMGSPSGEAGRSNDEQQHRVTLSRGFWLGKYEVTQGQWESVMGNNPSGFKGDGNLPVEQVSWDDCQAFIRKLNAKNNGKFRLPTEAEWEYACRAGTTTRFGFGDSDGDLTAHAWYDSNSGGKTHAVGGKKPNAWGLYDMHGNVWEWCQDWYGAYPGGAVTDPTGPSTGSDRVVRGGCWFDLPRICRSAIRGRNAPVNRSFNLGFRLALPAVQ